MLKKTIIQYLKITFFMCLSGLVYAQPSVQFASSGASYSEATDGGVPITITQAQIISTVDDLTPSHTAWQTSQSHGATAQTSTTGSGTGMTCSIETDGSGNATFVIVNGGSGYVVDEEITFTDPGSTSNTAVLIVATANWPGGMEAVKTTVEVYRSPSTQGTAQYENNSTARELDDFGNIKFLGDYTESGNTTSHSTEVNTGYVEYTENTTIYLQLDVIQDDRYEGGSSATAETVFLEINTVNGGSLGSQATFTYSITDDDSRPVVGFKDADGNYSGVATIHEGYWPDHDNYTGSWDRDPFKVQAIGDDDIGHPVTLYWYISDMGDTENSSSNNIDHYQTGGTITLDEYYSNWYFDWW